MAFIVQIKTKKKKKRPYTTCKPIFGVAPISIKLEFLKKITCPNWSIQGYELIGWGFAQVVEHYQV